MKMYRKPSTIQVELSCDVKIMGDVVTSNNPQESGPGSEGAGKLAPRHL